MGSWEQDDREIRAANELFRSRQVGDELTAQRQRGRQPEAEGPPLDLNNYWTRVKLIFAATFAIYVVCAVGLTGVGYFIPSLAPAIATIGTYVPYVVGAVFSLEFVVLVLVPVFKTVLAFPSRHPIWTLIILGAVAYFGFSNR